MPAIITAERPDTPDAIALITPSTRISITALALLPPFAGRREQRI